MKYYQTIPELGIKGRMNTPEEFDKIGLPVNMWGWNVLDIGCDIGAFLYECVRRGAIGVEGVELNQESRYFGWGLLMEQWKGYNDPPHIAKDISDVRYTFDLVLLLSVCHVAENGQAILDGAWGCVKDGGLLIIEINDRLQKEPVKLPEEAKFYGYNKDRRSVYHCVKNNG